jgi:hypothetical protein
MTCEAYNNGLATERMNLRDGSGTQRPVDDSEFAEAYGQTRKCRSLAWFSDVDYRCLHQSWPRRQFRHFLAHHPLPQLSTCILLVSYAMVLRVGSLDFKHW